VIHIDTLSKDGLKLKHLLASHSADKIGDKMEDETKDDVKDIMITCNTCGFEVDYDTPCPNGCDTEVTEMVNRIFSEEE
jgi:hypothetical protein